jgi:hypothetical protein
LVATLSLLADLAVAGPEISLVRSGVSWIWRSICLGILALLQSAPLTEQQKAAIAALSHAVAERPFPPNLVRRSTWELSYLYELVTWTNQWMLGFRRAVIGLTWSPVKLGFGLAVQGLSNLFLWAWKIRINSRF